MSVETKVTKLTSQTFIKAVKDINTPYDKKDQIKYNTETTNQKFYEELRDVAEELEDGDKLFQSTVDLLTRLEIDCPAGVKIRKEPVKKATAKKAASKKALAKPKVADHSKSNKAIVYKTWKGGTKDPEKLHKKVKEAVQLTTIKNWLKAWAEGKNLPTIANKK